MIVHVIYGKPKGAEGYGQRVICQNCLKDGEGSSEGGKEEGRGTGDECGVGLGDDSEVEKKEEEVGVEKKKENSLVYVNRAPPMSDYDVGICQICREPLRGGGGGLFIDLLFVNRIVSYILILSLADSWSLSLSISGVYMNSYLAVPMNCGLPISPFHQPLRLRHMAEFSLLGEGGAGPLINQN